MSVLCWRAQSVFFLLMRVWINHQQVFFFCLLSEGYQTGKLSIWSYSEVKHIHWLFFFLKSWLLSVLVHVESDWQLLAFVAKGLVVFAFECNWFWWSIWNNVVVFFGFFFFKSIVSSVSFYIFILLSDLKHNFLYVLFGFIFFVQTASLFCVCVLKCY